MTKKPCPGCGKTDPYRRVNLICAECAHAIKIGNQVLDGERHRAAAGRITVHWPQAFHWWDGRPFLDSESDDCQAFLQAMHQLVESVAEGVHNGSQMTGKDVLPAGNGYGSCARVGILTGPQLADLRAVYDAAGKMVKSAFQRGRDRGERFLSELATGEISMAEFDEVERARKNQCGR